MADKIPTTEEEVWLADDEPNFDDLRASLEGDEEISTDEVIDDVIDDTTDTMEQSQETLADSDIDAVDDDATTDVTEETNEGQPDDDTAESTTDETEQVQKYKVKANNMDFEFTEQELLDLAPKAMDYTKKMQEIAPYRKSISALKEAGLGQDDLNLAIDVLKGDKDAIAEVMKRNGVELDALDDIDDEAKEAYVPNQYGKDDTQLAIEEIVNEISNDVEYKITQRVVDTEWDGRSREALTENPAMIQGLHSDINNGIYDKVAPMAFKMKALDGGQKSDIEYYIEAGKEFYANEDNANALTQQAQDIKAKQEKSAQDSKTSKSRKAASITKSNSGKRDVINYLDDDDDETYNEWYKKVTSQ